MVAEAEGEGTVGEGRLAMDTGRGGCSVLRGREGRAVSSLERWERKEAFEDDELDTEPAAGLLEREVPE